MPKESGLGIRCDSSSDGPLSLPNSVMAKVASPCDATVLVCSETHLQSAQSGCRPEAPWVDERGKSVRRKRGVGLAVGSRD